ncbi:hypothetical protein ACTVZO_05450 [Streptomyces sp. IBSNAI002]|uniref:hypothetical protein n=1 Tax=Streptomyces sp. IBSNAI002 TaxID=3457500 RepID=UPI003FD0DCCC
MPIKRCTASFVAYRDGMPVVITVGQLMDSDDPLISGREALFEDINTHMARRPGGAESATAEPAEKRAVTLPRPTAGGRGRGGRKGAATDDAEESP